MNQSEHINELAAALAKAQGEIRNAEQDKVNPHFKSKYSSLAALWDACREPLSKNGLSITQTTQDDVGRVKLVTMLLHASGQWISSSMPIAPTLGKIQAFGSDLTYLRRYSLSCMVGLSSGDIDDDDGEESMKNEKAQKPAEKPVSKPKPTKDQLKQLWDLIIPMEQEFKNRLDSLLKEKGTPQFKDIDISTYDILKELVDIQVKKTKSVDVPKKEEEGDVPW